MDDADKFIITIFVVCLMALSVITIIQNGDIIDRLKKLEPVAEAHP